MLTGNDLDARTDMLLAASFAGMGFGNAGVHLPHACAYPIATGRSASTILRITRRLRRWCRMASRCSLTAPEAFRVTFATDPQRHLRAAELLDPRVGEIGDPRERLPRAIVSLMRDIGIPSGVGAVGYTEADVPDLVEGTLKQQRILSMAPRDIMPEDLEIIFRNSMSNW